MPIMSTICNLGPRFSEFNMPSGTHMQGRIMAARGPRPPYFLGLHAGATYLVACFKSVKVCPSYVQRPLKILSFVVPTLVLRLP